MSIDGDEHGAVMVNERCDYGLWWPMHIGRYKSCAVTATDRGDQVLCGGQ